jgi:hypothetical protein
MNWLAEREDGLRFIDCLRVAIEDAQLIKEFDRLNGTNLSMRGSGLDLEIDQVSGRVDSDLKQFSEFVWEYIYTRVPPKV